MEVNKEEEINLSVCLQNIMIIIVHLLHLPEHMACLLGIPPKDKMILAWCNTIIMIIRIKACPAVFTIRTFWKVLRLFFKMIYEVAPTTPKQITLVQSNGLEDLKVEAWQFISLLLSPFICYLDIFLCSVMLLVLLFIQLSAFIKQSGPALSTLTSSYAYADYV